MRAFAAWARALAAAWVFAAGSNGVGVGKRAFANRRGQRAFSRRGGGGMPSKCVELLLISVRVHVHES